jgi:outer membrane protein assembly factor BamB
MILCGSNDFHVYLLNADTGAIIAKIPTKGEVKGKIAISGDIAIAVTVSGRVYGIDLISLAIIWERRAGVATVHSFPIIEGSQCFVTNTSQVVMAIDVKTGNLNWVTKLRGSVHWGVTSLPVGLLALTENGYVVVLDKLTGSKLASDRITRTTTLQNPICYQPPAYDGASLVIVTNNQGVICFSVDFDKVLA